MFNDISGKISEIFTSLQGEGPYLGHEQIFVRFYGCNLNCKFCDTKIKYFTQYSLPQVLEKINSTSGIKSLSITGGEPLLQAKFISLLLPELKQRNFNIYLETNGTLVNELCSLIDYIDIVAMDFKLPSSTFDKNHFLEHEEFLKIARKKQVFVKAIISPFTTFDDIEISVDIIKRIDKRVCLVLQPDTGNLSRELFKKISYFRSYALEFLDTVRVIAQMHKLALIR